MVLSIKDLPALAEQGVSIPQYDRSQITAGVVHIGPSNFARGHLFKYFDQVLKQDPQWGVRAISLKSNKEKKPLSQLAKEFVQTAILPMARFQKPALPARHKPTRKEILKNQDYLYTVNEQSVDGTQRSVIGSLMDVTEVSEDPKGALDVLCDPNIKLVTITVTQAGYGHDPQTGNLDFERDDIKECLSRMDMPSTTVGYLVAALERRMKESAPPLTIMSCDNMEANGTILRQVVTTYATQKSSKLRKYIEENITFPSTMVDRIVPTTTNKDIFNSKAAGLDDEWPIMTEDFWQWVIENDFAGDMPDLESVGATVTSNVEPFELMKLRMLNGAHMALGCVAGLNGHTLVDKAMKNPKLKEFIQNFMHETATTVPPIEGIDFAEYQQRLIERLENPEMSDQLVRLARNGTGKVDTRFANPLKDAKAAGADYQHLAFATAAWIQYLKGYDDKGNLIGENIKDDSGTPLGINDKKAVESGLQDMARKSNGNPQPVMTASGLFDADLMKDQEFIKDVSRHLRNIQEHGVVEAINAISLTVVTQPSKIPATQPAP